MADTDEVAEIAAATDDSVGSRLRAAREAEGLSIDEVAARTRIPRRHLENMESGQWDRMPSPTYSIGFAKSYAAAVGLDRTAVADQLRTELSGYRSAAQSYDSYEAADPKRVPPRSLLLASLVAIGLVLAGLVWLNNRSLAGDEPAAPPETAGPAAGGPATPAAPVPAAPAAAGPVVLTANDAVWIKVTDGGTSIYQGTLGAGHSYEVPASAQAPKLTTGRPEALRISVGTADAPPVGEPGRTVSGVSLLAADLMRRPAAPARPAASPPAPSTPPSARPSPPAAEAPPPPENVAAPAVAPE